MTFRLGVAEKHPSADNNLEVLDAASRQEKRACRT